jgi:hypothetical protein
MERYRFGHTLVDVDPDHRCVITRFEDGTTVTACPQHDADYPAHALELGYTGVDVGWQMCRDHELFHNLMAWLYLGDVSPALWAVAHGEPLNRPDINHEEQQVLELQAQHRGAPLTQWRDKGD